MLPDSFPQFLYPCCTSLLNRRVTGFLWTRLAVALTNPNNKLSYFMTAGRSNMWRGGKGLVGSVASIFTDPLLLAFKAATGKLNDDINPSVTKGKLILDQPVNPLLKASSEVSIEKSNLGVADLAVVAREPEKHSETISQLVAKESVQVDSTFSNQSNIALTKKMSNSEWVSSFVESKPKTPAASHTENVLLSRAGSVASRA